MTEDLRNTPDRADALDDIPTDQPIVEDDPEGTARPETMAGQRVLLLQAHPDDAEFMCAATIARWIGEGAGVHYVSLTSGDKGSDDPRMTGPRLATLREGEQRAACELLGVRSVQFLGYLDATLVPDLAMRRHLTRVIRQVRPDVLVCQDPTARFFGQDYINHPDHIAAGEASLAAVFPSARDRMTFPELLLEGLEPHKVTEVFLYGTGAADTWIDVSGTIGHKIEALRKHASQLGDWNPDEDMRTWARETSSNHPDRPAGFGEYAEAFKYFKLG